MLPMQLISAVVKSGGVGVEWPETWSPANTHDTVTSGVTCYAVIEISSDGQVRYNSLGSGPSTSGIAGDWLSAGSTATDYYVQSTNYSGTPGTLNYADECSSRVQLGTDRHLGVTEITTGQSHICTFDLEFYTQPSGGSPIMTVSFTLDAFKDTP